MRRIKPFIRPELKKLVWGTNTPQQVEYLHISKNFSEKGLKQVIKDGGEQFQDISALTKKPMEPQFIVVTAPKQEEGFLAVSMIAGIYNEREKRGAWEDELDLDEPYEMDEDFGWEEGWDRIPVICFSDAVSYFDWNGNTYSPFQNTLMVSQRANDDYTPYWASNRNLPICICADYSDLGFPDRASDILGNFRTNRQVYILVSDMGRNWGFMDDEEERNQNINNVILRFTAEEISVPQKRSVSKYYENVWRQMVRQSGYQLERRFRIQELLQDVEKMNKDFSYDLLEQILKYAVRNKAPGILREHDFDFMERFAGKRLSAEGETRRTGMQMLKEDLVGMEQVKDQVIETVQIMKFNQIRHKMGIHSGGYHNVHMMLGAPGTAKTTVAHIMGKIMAEENLLPGSRFTCVNGAELKGMYVGHSAPKTKELFEENDIIVIDEAYSLSGNDGRPDSFSQEAIAQLVIELEEHATDKLVIFAGYGGSDVDEKHNRMKEFIDSNPGIKSRINSTFYFSSYSPEEMADIFDRHVHMNGYELPDGWRPVVQAYFEERVQDENFGNGREARALFEKVSVQMARRIMGALEESGQTVISETDARQCRLEDIGKAVERAKEENRQILGKQRVQRRIGF